jgi:hypothetical protein
MVMSYVIDNEKGFTAPERFKDATNGSWLVSYKVTDKEVYEAAKNGVFKGFSIEGVFNLIETGSTMEEEFMGQLYTELKKVSEYIIFFNDYPDAVVNNAKRGIELNEKNGNKCATQTGKIRARQLSQRKNLSLSTIRRMYSISQEQRNIMIQRIPMLVAPYHIYYGEDLLARDGPHLN